MIGPDLTREEQSNLDKLVDGQIEDWKEKKYEKQQDHDEDTTSNFE